MSQFTVVVLSEVGLLIIAGIVIILWLIWRRKKQQASELESLLQEVKATEAERNKKIIRHLTNKRKLQESAATDLAQELQQAEKQFLQFYLQYQFGQGSGAEFYIQLTELLDQYLKLIPIAEAIVVPETNKMPVFNKESLVKKAEQQEISVPEVIPVAAVLDISEEKIDVKDELYISADAFAEPLATVAEAVTESVLALSKADGEITSAPVEPPVEVDEFAGGDMDWGEAFGQTEEQDSTGEVELQAESEHVNESVAAADENVDVDEFGDDDLDWGAAFKEAEAGHPESMQKES